MSRNLPDASQMAAIVDRLRSEGLDAVWVDRAPVFDKTSLLHALYQSLPLTGDFGFNWDALEDALYGPENPDAPARVLIFRDFELLEERDPNSARVFTEIVRNVAEDPASTLRGMIRFGGPPADEEPGA